MTTPPVADKRPHAFEIHGRIMQDEYYWLREKDTPPVMEYLQQENEYTKEMMKHTEELQEALFQEMKGRIKETDSTVPMRFGDYYYYSRTEEGKNYQIHCRKHLSLDAEEEIVLDENKLAEGKKYMSVGAWKVSPDQKRLAYSVDFTGGETYESAVIEITTREEIDRIKQVGGQIQWSASNDAFFYTELDEIHRPYAVSLHRIGTPQTEDVRIYEESDTTFYLGISKSKDKRYLFIKISSSSSETDEIRFIDLQDPEFELQTFCPRKQGVEFDIDHHEGYFYFITSADGAVNFKLMRAPTDDYSPEKWEELIPHNPDIRLQSIEAYRNFLMLQKRQGGYAGLQVYELGTGRPHDVAFPEEIYGIRPIGHYEFDSDIYRFKFSSPVTPETTYDYNMRTRELELKKVEEIKNHDPSEFHTERRYAIASDGTKIPISLAFKKGTPIDGSSPLLLYGYGSYGYPADPHFDFKRLSLIERGVIFAIAHIRGGGEFGKPWYHQGKLANKMNTFTDFIACAEYLISEKYTSKDRLAIYGGSAGGLLMGAVVNMRPDLFKCVVASVPFVDVINTMLDESIPLTTFEFNEWGNPKIEGQFNWMIEYSPYDNVEAKEYPAMLITAGYNDPRVQYWEPAKWTAKLRAMKTDNNILLLKTKMETGHFSASGRYDYMRDFAFIFAFILDTLGLT